MSKPEIYVSVDVEADGPIPGRNSMLALGAAAFLGGTEESVATFEACLEPLEYATEDPDTVAWWGAPAQSEARAWLQAAPKLNPRTAMTRYSAWLDALPGKPVFVGYPATYDFMFVHWYLMVLVGRDPCGFQGLDVKTLAMAALGTDFRETTKRNMPRAWFEGLPPHTHRPLDDAIEQGKLFVRILREVRALRA